MTRFLRRLLGLPQQVRDYIYQLVFSEEWTELIPTLWLSTDGELFLPNRKAYAADERNLIPTLENTEVKWDKIWASSFCCVQVFVEALHKEGLAGNKQAPTCLIDCLSFLGERLFVELSNVVPDHEGAVKYKVGLWRVIGNHFHISQSSFQRIILT